MAPVTFPTRPTIPDPGLAPSRPVAARGANASAFEPVAPKPANTRAEAPATAKTAARPTPTLAADRPHVFTLQALSTYAGVLVGQIEGTPPGQLSDAAAEPRGTAPASPPSPPGSKLNIKI